MASKRVFEKNLAMSPGAGKPPSTRKAATSKRPALSTASVAIGTGVDTGVDATHEPIAAQAVEALAYSYWVARGCEGGSPEEDWLRAERELRESQPVVRYSNASA